MVKDMLSKKPLIYVNVLNYNAKSLSSETLQSLQTLTYNNWKTILVDNGSDDGSIDFLKEKFPWVTVLANKKNLGFGAGHNIGIRYAIKHEAQFIFLLNNDAEVNPTLLHDLYRVMQSDSSIGVAGPKILDAKHRDRIWFAGGKLYLPLGNTRHLGVGQRDSASLSGVVDEDYQSGCAMMIRKEAITKTGLFDPSYFMYWEDVDLCLRMKRQGYRVVCVREAKVWHRVSASTGGHWNASKAYLKARSGVTFVRHHAPLWMRWSTIPLAALIYIMVTALLARTKGQRGLLKAYFKGIADGLKDPASP
jgi:GT2 family glycosyltransferase